MALEKQVILRGPSLVGAVIPEDDELAAEAGIKPGHLLAYDGDGQFVRHGTGSPAPRLVALERDEVGDDLEVAYADGDTVKKAPLMSGCTYNLILASGQDLAKGAEVIPAAGGEVTAGTGANIIGTLEEDVDASAGAKRAAVRVA